MKIIKVLFDKPSKQYAIASTIWLAIFGAWHDSLLVIISELLFLFISFSIIGSLWALSISSTLKLLQNERNTKKENDYDAIKENRDGLVQEVTKLRATISRQAQYMQNLGNLVHLIYSNLSPTQRASIIEKKSELEQLISIDSTGGINNENI